MILNTTFHDHRGVKVNELMTNRYEKKFILSFEQTKLVYLTLLKHLTRDQYSKENQVNHVYNIYYDTNNYSFIRHSISKPTYKDKLRIRSYHIPVHDQDSVFLEIKKKYRGHVNKRRLEVTYKEAKSFLNHGIIPKSMLTKEQFAINEIKYLMEREGQIQPKVFISYERLGFNSDDLTLRVTLDSNLRFRLNHLSFSSDDAIPIMANKNDCIMEIKSTKNFPLWLVRLLSELNVYAKRFSKYGQAYQKILEGGKIYDYLFLDYLT